MRMFPFVKILILILLFIHEAQSVQVHIPVEKHCPPNQIRREYSNNGAICCYPVKCHPGQRAELCSQNHGHDTCQNCPDGYTHYDELDTSTWKYPFNPCIVQIEDCKDYSDLIKNEQTGQCECDRSRGYYGHDKNLCSIDNGTCKKAGFMLTLEGECQECDEDSFKVEEGKYGLCKPKTRCTALLEVDDPGSSSKDRTCRAKSPVIKTTIPPYITSTITADKTALNAEKRNISDGLSISKEGNDTKVETKPDREENRNSQDNTVFIVIAIFVACCVCLFVVGCCYFGRTGHQDEVRHICRISCCNKNKEINLKVNNLLIGNGNSTIQTDGQDIDTKQNFLYEPVNQDIDDETTEEGDVVIPIDDDTSSDRLEPDGTESNSTTYIKEIYDGASQTVDSDKTELVSQRNSESQDLGFSSLLGSGIPNSNRTNPGIQCRRVQDNYL